MGVDIELDSNDSSSEEDVDATGVSSRSAATFIVCVGPSTVSSFGMSSASNCRFSSIGMA